MTEDSGVTRISTDEIRSRKGGAPLVCLTAYTTPMAKSLDAHCDLLLVGDSLAMVIYGLETTRGVTLDIMIAHGQAVMRGAQRSCVVVDLPHGSYENSHYKAVASACRVIEETSAQAVKLEGGAEMAETVAAIVNAGVPVLGHVGLLPQKAEHRGGFKIQGKDDEGAKQVMADARAMTEDVDVPTIGIGASPACDGQILVTQDMVGLFADFTPKFVKRYVDLGAALNDAAKAYADDVRNGRFPGLEHCFGVEKPES